MVVLLVLLTIVGFITADVLVRYAAHRIKKTKELKKRREALDIGLKLVFKEDAPTLKRVEVDKPKAWILAVDDEPVILDSFRKILVLDGYSVDTVETGPEAVGLVRKHEYDFVFTDLKMPEMDGLEVTKAVKHLRPDIDVIMITGFATIESAVDAMKFGATDYVQKPFSEEELTSFAEKCVVRRKARIESRTRPKVQLVTAYSQLSPSERVFNIPAGVFIHSSHAWVSIEMNGDVRVGLDDFTQKLVGPFDGIVFPEPGARASKGKPLFTLKKSKEEMAIPAPINGRVAGINEKLKENPNLLKIDPYELGWICTIQPSQLTDDLISLRVGPKAEEWYQGEIDRYQELLKKAGKGKVASMWEAFAATFVKREG